jgi:hypothetical protein
LKKKWKKPELQVIIRNRPEEAVLTGCKELNFAGASNSNNSCMTQLSVPCDSPCSTQLKS